MFGRIKTLFDWQHVVFLLLMAAELLCSGMLFGERSPPARPSFCWHPALHSILKRLLKAQGVPSNVGESSAILLTIPSPSLLKRLLKEEGGAAE